MSYTLDSSTNITINKLEFKDTSSSFFIQSASFLSLTLPDQISSLINTQRFLDVTLGKGYLNTLDLSTYPIISEILPFFIKEGDNKE